jgi:outer membrane immunogenic protein
MIRWTTIPVGLLALGLPALGLAPALRGGAARAADLPARKTAPLPYLAPPAFTWTGVYAGVNVGYGFSERRSYTDATYGAVTGLGGGGGVIGGGQVGYNYQFTPGSGFVVGLEADYQGAKLNEKRAGLIGTTPYLNVSPGLDYFGTVRGRVGYAVDRLLVFGTAGLAYGGGSRPSFASSYPYTLPRETGIGWAAGAGVEYALTQQLSAKIEALYVNIDRGRAGATATDAATAAYYGTGRVPQDYGVVRAGLNYRFSTD